VTTSEIAPADPRRKRGGRRSGERVPAQGRGVHRCMVLACTADDTAAVDLDSGALVRMRTGPERQAEAAVAPFDVVDAVWAADPERDDLAQPEAVTVAGVPRPVGTIGGRRARQLLRHLVVPSEQHLLGFPGSSAPYWEFGGMRPSLAVVVPSRGPLLFRRADDPDTVWARFGWPRSDNWLPVEDPHAIEMLRAARRDRLSGKDLANALGFRPHYLVVALSRPRDGYCYKTVAAILPRP
jgi:hypothetical protein